MDNNRQLTSSSSSIIFTLLQIWSDGFDPSGIKKNRNGVWLYTLTVIISGKYFTYAIGFCNKKNNSENVDIMINEDLKKWVLQVKSIFCYATKSVVEIFIISYLVKMDEPKRRERIGIKLGSGAYCQCFGHIYDFVRCEEELCSCESCIIENTTKLTTLQSGEDIDNSLFVDCDECLN